MKHILLVFSLIVFNTAVFGQTDVTLNINHLLGSNPFQFNSTATNNNGVQFNVDRLQYYVSQVSIIHDGGQMTQVPGTWFLIDASGTFSEVLGNFSVNNVEGIRFGIGVEQAVNHLDPSTYTWGHPLAPQSPSMHWGWSSGYRFVAMEGSSGNNMSQTYEIHALDDNNYFMTTVMATGSSNGNGISIGLDADYARALENIDVSTGVINHGGSGEARTVLQNFRDFVFSPSSVSTAVEDGFATEMAVYPNPATSGSRLSFTYNGVEPCTVQVTDMTGKVILQKALNQGSFDLGNIAEGCYMVTFQNLNGFLGSKKLLITK